MTLRPATLDDSARLLAWRNDPETRRNSLSPWAVSAMEHEVWLACQLRDPTTCRLYIAEVADAPVGTARIDLWPDEVWCEISITVAPERRGQGLGGQIMIALREELARLGLKQVIAKVRGYNVPSLRMFLSAGFVPATHVIRLELQ